MKKAELRRKYKSLRENLPEYVRQQKSIDIANLLLSMPIWHFSVFHTFLPIEKQNEVDTHHILNILQGKDKKIVVPKTNFASGNLTHFFLTENTTFRENKWGLCEPSNGIEAPIQEIDVVFVPLLAYDKNGNRVGYGKGFYDRFFNQCQHKIIKIGLSFFEPEPLIEDISPSDVAVDFCVTPHKIFSFAD